MEQGLDVFLYASSPRKSGTENLGGAAFRGKDELNERSRDRKDEEPVSSP